MECPYINRQCELTHSHNYAMLAQHMRHLTPYEKFPLIMKVALRQPSSRLQFGLMYFYQGDLCLMRGLLPEAIDFLHRAAVLVPGTEGSTRAQVCSVLATAEQLAGSSRSKCWVEKTNQIHLVDRTKASYSYVQLHTGILRAATGNFSAAEATVAKGATRVLMRKDCSPLRAQISIMLNWFQFVTGRPELVIESMKTIYAEENGLKKIWSFELLVLMYALQGRYLRCYEILQKLKTIQGGRYGTVFHTALSGFVGTLDGKHASPIAEDRDEVLSALLFAGDKLAAKEQTSPIGIMCLFCVSYSMLSILHPGVVSSVSKYSRPGGGTIFRLNACLAKTMKAFAVLSKRLPFLSLLNTALLMKQAVVLNKPHGMFDEHFNIAKLVMLYSQFALGTAILVLEWKAYTAAFGARRMEGCDKILEEIMRQFGIPSNHFLCQPYLP